MLTVEKLTGGYVVSHDHTREVATPDHVAHLIARFWPDVLECIEELRASHAAETDPQPEHPHVPERDQPE